MKIILRSWIVIRMVRLMLGILIIAQGFVSKDAVTILLGIALGGLALVNAGCCGAQGCEIPQTPVNKTTIHQYEELDPKK